MFRKLLILSAALSCGLISAALTLRIVRNTQTTSAPDVTGRTLADATQEATQRRLRLKVGGRRNHSKIGLGRVVEQDPPAGTSIKESRTLRVVLSLGPKKTEVPDVLGLALRSARLRLEGVGVPIRRVIEAPSDEDEDSVVVQVPEAGVVEDLGEGVLLIVARNGSRHDYVMPDLVGRSLGETSQAFESRGFVPPQIHYKSYPGLASGTILSQSPLAGYRVNPRAAVILEVSQGS